MPSSADILIASEIAASIKLQSFSQELSVERVYAADWDLKTELDELQVGVWPGESEATPWERNKLLKSYRTGVSFAKKISAESIEELDKLCDLVSEVQEFLELTIVHLADGREFANQGWEYLVRFVDTELDRNRGSDGSVKYTGLFASVLVIDFVSLE